VTDKVVDTVQRAMLTTEVEHVGAGLGDGDGLAGARGMDEATGTLSAREAPGLSTSATSPTRRTVAAIAPRRAALIGRTAAERV
jgi:hypothetical protein